MISEAPSLITIATILKTKMPVPVLAAWILVLPETISPITAPITNPINIPNGGKTKIPTSIPIVEPIIPLLDALNNLPPNIGIA